MQDRGLEWLFRLVVEPRQLWRRYLLHNPRFVVLALQQVLRHRIFTRCNRVQGRAPGGVRGRPRMFRAPGIPVLPPVYGSLPAAVS